jgi:hypothetical protein
VLFSSVFLDVERTKVAGDKQQTERNIAQLAEEKNE